MPDIVQTLLAMLNGEELPSLILKNNGPIGCVTAITFLLFVVGRSMMPKLAAYLDESASQESSCLLLLISVPLPSVLLEKLPVMPLELIAPVWGLMGTATEEPAPKLKVTLRP
jgi:hypothetical protein